MKNTMRKISSKEARDQMADVLNQVAYQRKRYTLTRHGKGIAVIVSMEEWQAYEQWMEKMEDEQDIKDADAVLGKIRKGEKTISHAEVNGI